MNHRSVGAMFMTPPTATTIVPTATRTAERTMLRWLK